MKLSTLLILAFLVGCSGAPDTGSDEGSGGGTGQADQGGYYGDRTSGGGPGACGNAFQTLKMNLPDGGVVVIVVPIPCNPYWHDTGDPPPDREKQKIVDPPPDEIIVREQEQQYVR